MDAPKYLWDLLDRELRYSHTELLKKVATKYNLPLEEMISEFIPKQTPLVPAKQVPIVIHKKMPPKQEPQEQDRCFARVWNRGKGGRCTRARTNDCDYCAQHVKHRKHGDMREEAPREMYPKRKNTYFL